MSHSLSFEHKVVYDPGDPGITIPISLRSGPNSVNFLAKIDTGATFCIFQRSIGEQLEIDIEAGEKRSVRTVTGSFNVYAHGATLVTESIEFDAIVHFAEDERFERNVLGRFGWLNRLKIGLVDYEGQLFLSGYNYE